MTVQAITIKSTLKDCPYLKAITEFWEVGKFLQTSFRSNLGKFTAMCLFIFNKEMTVGI